MSDKCRKIIRNVMRICKSCLKLSISKKEMHKTEISKESFPIEKDAMYHLLSRGWRSFK